DSLLEFLFHPRLYALGAVRVLRLSYTLFFKWIHQYSLFQGSHGLSLKEHNVRVPLIFVGHPAFPAGRVIQDQVSQIDILPTLLDVLQIPAKRGTSIQGRSLRPLIAGEPLAARPVYMETYSGKSVASRYLPMKPMGADRSPRPPALVGIRTPEWKCTWVPEDPRIQTELYHLASDPLESKNVSDERPEVTTALKACLSVLQSPPGPSETDR
ncbi:MAG: sulfatase, partial [Anaerolineales bacterium]|nr:sulfatase [Anaerolineales bacterium]